MKSFNQENDPVALVTGSSAGFGLLCSVELAKAGFCVIASMRDTKKQDAVLALAREQGVENRLYVYSLDVASEASIIRLEAFLQSIGRVDVLVNNAGFALGGFAEEISMEEWRVQFETNFFGVIRVTQAVLPLMRKRMSGRIINMSSISGRMGFPGLAPYVASKFAVEGYSESLGLEVSRFGIDVVLIEPGSYATTIWSTGKRIAAQSKSIDSPYASLLQAIDEHLTAGMSKYGDPKEVAELIVHAATVKRPALRYPIGRGVWTMIRIRRYLPWNIWKRLIDRTLKR